MSEKAKETNVVQETSVSEQSGISKKKNLKNKKWVLMAVAAVMIGVIVGITVYMNSPAYRARQKLNLGERYLEELDYEQVILNFKLALEIDPDNKEIVDAISLHMDEFYTIAREYVNQEMYSEAKEVTAFMLTLDSGNDKAKRLIREMDVIMSLLDLCEEEDWTNIADFVIQDEFTPIQDRVDEEGSAEFTEDETKVRVENNDGSICIICPPDEQQATGIVSSPNTNAIYEGEWADGVPNGKGTLTIWNKNENISEANIYTGVFKNGLLNKNAKLTTWIDGEQHNVSLKVKKGIVYAHEIREDGTIILTDEVREDGCAYVAEYAKGSDNVISDYEAGVPGYGGSDYMLKVNLRDVTPPEIQCVHNVNSYVGGINSGITATDNIDGDLTSKIVYESTRTASFNGYNTEWMHGLKVVYSVEDSSGNKAELTVTYDREDVCGYIDYTIRSIQ